MIFEKETVSFHILDVIFLDQENVKMFNSQRNFDALSFRIKANTTLETPKDTYELGDNSVAYVPAGVEYTRISKNDKLIVVHMHTLGYSAKKIEHFTSDSPDKLKALFEDILKIWESKEKGYKHKAGALLYTIFAQIYEERADERHIDPKIQNSVEFIEKNYLDPAISITDIAARSNISEVYFRKLFKKQFGISPKKYIINARIRFSLGLMEHGYYSLQEIAEKSGFTDYKYFSSEFKKETGMSPSKYFYNYPH